MLCRRVCVLIVAIFSSIGLCAFSLLVAEELIYLYNTFAE